MKKVLLMILDGFGYREEREYNAYRLARAPFLNRLFRDYPYSLLTCHGRAVGLPEGVMGNSEVGHMNIGAGRIVKQDLVRINDEIEDGTFSKNPVLQSAFRICLERGSQFHLMGLLSDGGVHSHIDHIYALLKAAKKAGLKEVYLHAFMDGRDTPPSAGINYIRDFLHRSREIGIGKIATISGRYYAMDRDKRWDRTEKAYRALVDGKGEKGSDPETIVLDSYRNKVTDEFILPSNVVDSRQEITVIRPGDVILAFNFRADRMRQITRAFTDPEFQEFTVSKLNLHYLSMTEYDETFKFPVLFPPVQLKNILGELIAEEGLRQLRIAETEKYAHVTYFFNGGEEKRFRNEDRLLVPSPKVATYDLKPEMSAIEVTDKLLEKLKDGRYDLIVLNYANGDMVGHTGVLEAAIRAIETLDSCIGKVVTRARQKGYAIILTADHGNSELMRDPESGEPHTAHTLNPVPFLVIDEKVSEVQDGILADIAPTILKIMNLPQPREMSGKPLV